MLNTMQTEQEKGTSSILQQAGVLKGTISTLLQNSVFPLLLEAAYSLVSVPMKGCVGKPWLQDWVAGFLWVSHLQKQRWAFAALFF